MKSIKRVIGLGTCLLVSNISLAALVAHFDGTQITAADGRVAGWDNQGAGGDAAAPVDPGARPLIVSAITPNGTTNTVLDFDGVDDCLEIASDPADYDTHTFTWFIVFKSDEPGRNILRSAYAAGSDSNAGAMWGDFHSGNGYLYSHARSATGGFMSKKSLIATGRWHLVECSWNGNTLRQWLDTVDLNGAISGVNANPSGHLRTRIGANAATSPGEFFKGQIAEVRIYNEDMLAEDSTKRLAVEKELMEKYMLAADYSPLDADDPSSSTLFSKSILFARPTTNDHYRIPSLLQLPNGDILARSTLKIGNMLDNGGESEAHYKLSQDDGRTWSAVGGYGMGAVVDEQTGRLWAIGNHWPAETASGDPINEAWMINNAEEALSLGAGVTLYSSDASGQNWITTDVTAQFYRYPGLGLTSWIGRGIQLRKGPHAGRLILPGRCYGQISERVGPDAHNVVAYSDDHGATWQWGGMSQGYCGEACIVELSDGSVYMNNRNHDPITSGWRSYAISHDGGETFTEFGTEGDLPSARCHASLARYSDPDGESGPPGRVLFLNPSVSIPGRTLAPTEGRKNMTVRLSYDDCKTWPVSKVLDAGKAGYSDMIVTRDGTVLCAYESGKDIYAEDITLVRFEIEWLESGFTPKVSGTPSLYQAWAATYLLTNGSAALTANPDGDLLDNLGEYAMGGDPTNGSDTGYLPHSAMVQDGEEQWFQYVYYARNDAAERGLSYYLETSSDLVSGVWTTNCIVPCGIGQLNSEFVSVTNRLAITPAEERFMRLRIQL